MRWGWALLVAALGLGGFAAWFFTLPPPQQLNRLDSLWPGDDKVVRVVHNLSLGDDEQQSLNVWRPAEAKDSDKLPVMVFYYGGGWYSGDKEHYEFAAKAYASRGYVVVLPDYRLVPDGKFPAMLEDSAAALAWVDDNIATYGGDPDRIFIGGHSAGAYNVLMLALDRQWLGRLGKDTGIIKGVVSLAGPADFYPFTSNTAIEAMSHVAKPEITQPINYARADAPPLWLATGTADTVVRPRNSRVLAAKMAQIGGMVELKEYPDGSHNDIIMAISRPFRSSYPVLDDSIAFMEAHGAK